MKKWANQYHRSRNEYPSAGGLLDNQQKAHICILAREAWEQSGNQEAMKKICGSGSEFLDSWIPDSKSFPDWRRNEQFKAAGKESLTDCLQADYLKLVAHFNNLKGETGRAVKAHLGAAVQEKEIALKKLKKECDRRGLDLSYPGKICRSKFKRTIDEATPRQLWCLVFDIRTSHKPVINLEARNPGKEFSDSQLSTPLSRRSRAKADQLLNQPF